MANSEQVTIAEVCPRDGFQSLPDIVPTEDKIDLVHQLQACGFKQIEVTSFVHPKAIPQLADADEVAARINRKEGVILRALVPNARGLDRAIRAGVDKVKLMLSATDAHSLSNANRSTMDAMSGFEPLIEIANEHQMALSGSISVAFGCPYEGDVPIDRLKSICERYRTYGIKQLSLADTTGMGNPAKVRRVIRALQDAFPDFSFSLHLHNTRGMAFANAIAGYEEGIRDFDSSAAGLGGCPYAPNASGNIASEDLIHGFEEMGIPTGIDLDQVLEVARRLQARFPLHADSFLLKAGKCSDLHLAPKEQIKLG